MSDYAFYFLDKKQQILYYLFRNALCEHAQTIPANNMDVNDINIILKAVLTDTPELFWFEGKWEYVMIGDVPYIHPLYTIDISEACVIQQRIKKLCHEIARGNHYRSEIDQIRYVYDWIITNVDYGVNHGRGQTVFDAFIKHKAVCKGLSKGFQLILKEMGLFSTLQEGTIDGVSKHVWNIVEIDGLYYNVDVSLGYERFSYLFEDDKKNDRYRCFAISSTQLSKYLRIQQMPWPSLI